MSGQSAVVREDISQDEMLVGYFMSCQSEGEAVVLRQERFSSGLRSQLSRVTRAVAGVAFSH